MVDWMYTREALENIDDAMIVEWNLVKLQKNLSNCNEMSGKQASSADSNTTNNRRLWESYII